MAKRLLVKLICLCLAICMMLSTVIYVNAVEAGASGGETVQIVCVKEDVKAGERISSSNVELVTVKNANIPENVITNVEDVFSKYASQDLYAGDYIYEAQVTSQLEVSGKTNALTQAINKCDEKFLIVSDYVAPNTGEDITAHLQVLISKNPGRTIYFPDGEYIISSSLYTSSEKNMSTTFYFSSNAVLKAADTWKDKDGRNALICLGTKKADGTHVNDNTSNSSYFGVFGGVFDGNNKADGIAIVSGRETVIYGCTILNAINGIDIKLGANSVSSDSDIENVTIVGNGKIATVGINIIGYDNTFSNIRIYDMEKGIHVESGGNSFRSIEIYQTKMGEANYMRTVGIEQTKSTSFFYDCYVENCATAYWLEGGSNYVMDSMNAKWTYAAPQQKAFKFNKDFNCRLAHCRVDFYNDKTTNFFVESNGAGARARIDFPILNSAFEKSGYYKSFLTKNGIFDLAEK